MLALPYIDEVVECPVCCGWGNISVRNWNYWDMTVTCTYCLGKRTMFLGEVRMREFEQLAAHG